MSTLSELTKAAMIREPAPIGQPSRLYLNCRCGAKPTAGNLPVVCACGVAYSGAGWVLKTTGTLREAARTAECACAWHLAATLWEMAADVYPHAAVSGSLAARDLASLTASAAECRRMYFAAPVVSK